MRYLPIHPEDQSWVCQNSQIFKSETEVKYKASGQDKAYGKVVDNVLVQNDKHMEEHLA